MFSYFQSRNDLYLITNDMSNHYDISISNSNLYDVTQDDALLYIQTITYEAGD